MSEDLLVNPFRETFSSRQSPEPCVIIIFGATGDLTHRKLIPAIYNLSVDGDLPSPVKVIGFARRDKSDEEFRDDLEKLNRKVSPGARRQALADILPIDFLSSWRIPRPRGLQIPRSSTR